MEIIFELLAYLFVEIIFDMDKEKSSIFAFVFSSLFRILFAVFGLLLLSPLLGHSLAALANIGAIFMLLLGLAFFLAFSLWEIYSIKRFIARRRAKSSNDEDIFIKK